MSIIDRDEGKKRVRGKEICGKERSKSQQMKAMVKSCVTVIRICTATTVASFLKVVSILTNGNATASQVKGSHRCSNLPMSCEKRRRSPECVTLVRA